MAEKRGFLIAILACFVLSISFASASIELKDSFFKVSASGEDFISKPLTISSASGGEFDLTLLDLQGVVLGSNYLSLNAGESKDIAVSFNSSRVPEGVYVGSVKISGKDDVRYLPVIFEVETNDVFYDISLTVPSKYTEISPGGNAVVQMGVFDLTSGGENRALGTQEVEMEYKIHDIDGTIINSKTENISVSAGATLTKTLEVPKNTKDGIYVFSAVMKYKSSVRTASQIFNVKKSNLIFSGFKGIDMQLLIIIIAAIVLFAVIAAAFAYFSRDRDKLILELERYNAAEERRQMEFLRAQVKALTKKKKKASSASLKKEVEHRIRELKVKQVKRVEELRALKKKGQIADMRRKVDEWKKRGYNPAGLEYKLKGLTAAEMKGIMAQWKKKYKI